MTFGERLKRYRVDHGLTQAELGALLDIPQNTISQYESGARNPGVKVHHDVVARLEAGADPPDRAERPVE